MDMPIKDDGEGTELDLGKRVRGRGKAGVVQAMTRR